MKHFKIQMAILFVALACSTAFAQTIRRVNNTGITLGANMYADLQTAHNAAAAGDIIYVDGSGDEYGNLTLTKKLTIIGPGYFLGENYANFPDTRTANLTNVTFNAGSEGSIIMGCMHFVAEVKTSNITVTRNYDLTVEVGYGINSAMTGVVITKNYDIYIANYNGVSVTYTISNNYTTGASINYTAASGVFANNIIAGSVGLNAFNLSNNILLSSSPTLTNCTVANNIDARALSGASAFGTSNGNMANIDKTTLFVGSTGNSTDGQWKLKTGSVAIGAGVGATDCGMFGGSDTYNLSGLATEYPSIIKLTTSGSGSNTTPLSVTISTKSN